MSLKATVLFDLPQSAIGALILEKMAASIATTIVTGFATPGGLRVIEDAIKSQPRSIKAIVLGAVTYPGFEALDALSAAGVPLSCLHVHLGHTCDSGGRKRPTVRYHPMLHSKIYYMEFRGGSACAFIGSHNLTSFALTGLNGEAGVLLEGSADSPEFGKVRAHINESIRQSVQYSPDMKESLAWWTREFLDGLRSEVRLPSEWSIVRTILIFARAAKRQRPAPGDTLYFEIPAGIEQIDSLKTETHLFLFETVPDDPWAALYGADAADASYTCTTLGADNLQGNREVIANWSIDDRSPPALCDVASGSLRPAASRGMQQVRAQVKSKGVALYEYLFEHENKAWIPEYSDETLDDLSSDVLQESAGALVLQDDYDTRQPRQAWKLVKRLVSRDRGGERDQLALELVTPQSGSFLLVSLRRRRKDRGAREED